MKLESIIFDVRLLLLGIFGLLVGQIQMNFFTYLGGGLLVFWILSFCGHLLLKEEEKKNKLAIAYVNAKDALSESPNNPTLRQAALRSGKEYYAACRGGTITVYDEAAINNDIQACLADRSDANK